MPLYDYRCPKCGLEFEVSRPMSRATEPALCPQDSTESERLYNHIAAFIQPGGDSTPRTPSANDNYETLGGHGHSHGPGGHTH